ncbi:MAG: hypothetical protein WA979_04465 [Pacificimonas sp.]
MMATAPVSAVMAVTAASYERPGLGQEAVARAEQKAADARAECVGKSGPDRIAVTNCIAQARAEAYREQANVDKRQKRSGNR